MSPRVVGSVVLDLLGIVALTIGGWWLAPWVGMVVLGLGLLVVAWALDPPKREVWKVDIDPADDEESPEEADETRYRPAAGVPGLDWGPPQL